MGADVLIGKKTRMAAVHCAVLIPSTPKVSRIPTAVT